MRILLGKTSFEAAEAAHHLALAQQCITNMFTQGVKAEDEQELAFISQDIDRALCFFEKQRKEKST